MKKTSNNEGELLAAVDGAVYPLSADECVFRARSSGDKHVMTLQVLKAMDLCSTFRTLDGHVRAVMNGIEELKGRDQDVRRVLDSLFRRGLMVTAERALDELGPASDDGPAAGLAGLFVRSAGRPVALDRLLASVQRQRDEGGFEQPCFVLDDAHDDASSAECRAACERRRESGLDVRWLGRDWQRDFTTDLARHSGADPALLDWLTAGEGEGFSGGRLWNLALLACAGRRLLMADDDIVCEARRWGDAGGLALGAADWQLWFHADAEAAARAGEPAGIEPLAEHARMLGAPLPRVLESLGQADELVSGVDQRRLQALRGAPPVIATVSGTYGDAASSSNLWFFTQTGESRERLWASREAFESNRRTRWITRVRDRHALQPLSQFTPVGLDGSRMLPPTLPAGRNEDFLFSVLLHRLHPRARTLEFPWAMGHFPEEERGWLADALNEPLGETLARFIGDSLLNLDDRLPGAGPQRRLQLIADQLAGLAAESDRELTARLDEYLLYVRSDLVRQLQAQLLANPRAPVYWAADVQSIIKANGKALTGDEPPRLSGLPVSDGDPAGVGALRESVGRFAEALAAWPAIWAAARELDALS